MTPGASKKRRQVGAYLGLVPRQRQSGERDPQLRISKAGDRELRTLLVQCAHYIVGFRGPDCDLRRWAQRRLERGGANQKKRVVVAVARKLAVLLHRLWVSGEAYEPLRRGGVAWPPSPTRPFLEGRLKQAGRLRPRPLGSTKPRESVQRPNPLDANRAPDRPSTKECGWKRSRDEPPKPATGDPGR